MVKVLSKGSSSLQAGNELVEVWDLHIDEPHPHVHLVVRALSDEGKRFNIKKATLRHWRAQFAQHLRAQGVAANATERAVRDQRGLLLTG